MSEWQKDLSAVGFEAADLVNRARTLYLATLVVSEGAPEPMAESVGQARFKLHAALDLLDGVANDLLQLDDEQQLTALADIVQIKVAGPRFSRPGEQ